MSEKDTYCKPKITLKHKIKLRPTTSLRVFEAFAGYGGATFALKKTGKPFTVVGYSETDQHAIHIYNTNHPNIKNYGDISTIDETALPDFDFFTGGFPCQSFSSAGLGLGELDIRGTLFHSIIRIVSCKKPQLILLENVKGLLSKRHKLTFAKIISGLTDLGYKTYYNLLNTKDYGIPQNRERVWIFATLNKNFDSYFQLEPPPFTSIPPRIKDFLDITADPSLYLSTQQINHLIAKHKVDLDVTEKLCLDIYNKKVKHDGICSTLTEPHHNTIRIVEPKIIGTNGNPDQFVVRKLSETEHFRLMGFKDGEINFSGLSYTQLCKKASNGWDINVVSLILKEIFSKYYK